MKIYFKILALLFLSVACTSDNDDSNPAKTSDKTRSFLMGFTPWPHDATVEAVEWTYDTINENGDIISHHMEEGVPWPEAYAGESFADEFQTEIDSRIDRYQADKKVLLSVSPLNMGRDGMALYRGSSESMTLSPPWDSYELNSDEVKTAFLNYTKSMIRSFEPDYLIIGVEVNLLIRNSPNLWNAYIELNDSVYTAIKEEHPDLPTGVSVFCVPYFPDWSPEDNLEKQLAGLKQLEDSSDFIAFSVHPFMSALTAETFPDDYLEKLFKMTTKPVAVSESSYPAQYWQTITVPIIDFNGTPEKQNNFLLSLLNKSDAFEALFVIWFSIHDYDALWEGALNNDPIGLVWRDTGLFDEAGKSREAFDLWQSWYQREYKEE